MKMLSRHRRDRIPTSQSLENAALFYLGRFAASEASLRRVLENRLRRAALQNPSFAQDETLRNHLRGIIDVIIVKHRKTGALNDAAYAETKTASWRRAGRSARAIRQRLGKSGVASTIVKQALDQNADNENEDAAELKAALTLARRRKLGAFRKGAAGLDQGRKDLATLARAGFSFDVARRALGGCADDVADDI
jgi:regulatory protein